MPEMNLQFDARHSATVTYTAPVAKYRFVSWAGAHATDAAAVQGISELAGPAGRAGSLVTSYSYVVEAAGAIPAGSSVAPSGDGTGRAVVAGSGGCGRAITAAAAAGDLVTVVMQLGGAPVSPDGNLASAAVSTTTGTPGQIVKLSDGPDKGACLVWAIPEGATAYAWCWQIYPLAAYL